MKEGDTVVVIAGSLVGNKGLIEQIYGTHDESLVQILLGNGRVKFLPRRDLMPIAETKPTELTDEVLFGY